MSALQVIQPGPLSLLMDGGRHGWLHQGVSPSGPLDVLSAAWANRLLDNPAHAPLLEVSLGGVQLQALDDCQLAFTGAQMPLQVAGVAQHHASSFILRAGERLEIGYAQRGQRGYLAIAGDFAAPAVLGSVATQVQEGLGGLHGDGRPLQVGDTLRGGSTLLRTQRSVPWRFRPSLAAQVVLRLLPGGDVAAFSAASKEAFFAQTWQLSAASNRMGARLAGSALAEPPRLIYSKAMTLGAVQVPPDGQPIVLMADHQSMGGYPLLGWVHPLDLPALAQLPAGGHVRFSSVSLDDMQAEWRTFYAFFTP
ncbi:biotin-dependent carboxyltransferase family protein [Atopomonas sediminilitoris]|uniref:5-oxoprolinase subunit C family protein n=1 Tax=Atopomonas sediminilitoris TaxID=2919919 RepID=UPI001F4DE9A7|nr:biotin-dependent carboxyltransferase family protein [Atopomonas sediminilitoris]